MGQTKTSIIVLILFCNSWLHAEIDTIRVNADTTCNSFMPHREHIVLSPPTPEEKPIEYSDSIRVCGQVIDGFRKQYYLIVYDKSGIKRMEGNFWDHLANGHCINYDFRGRKISEGDYKLVRKKKYYYPSVKTGTWTYYDIGGKVIKKEEFRFTSRFLQHELPELQITSLSPAPSTSDQRVLNNLLQ